jgi:hypothetical protein
MLCVSGGYYAIHTVAPRMPLGKLQVFASHLIHLEIAEHWVEQLHRLGIIVFYRRLPESTVVAAM